MFKPNQDVSTCVIRLFRTCAGTCALTHLHTYAFAYLRTCVLAHSHTCALVYLSICVLAHLRSLLVHLCTCASTCARTCARAHCCILAHLSKYLHICVLAHLRTCANTCASTCVLAHLCKYLRSCALVQVLDIFDNNILKYIN